MDPVEVDGGLGEGRTATNLTTVIPGGRVRLRARHAPASPSGRRWKKQAALAGVGQPTGPPGGLPGKWPR